MASIKLKYNPYEERKTRNIPHRPNVLPKAAPNKRRNGYRHRDDRDHHSIVRGRDSKPAGLAASRTAL